MSDISIFTAVKYNNNLDNPPVQGWCAKQLDNWTFPLFGSKIEVIEFNKDNTSDLKVALFQENTTKSPIYAVAFRILLFVTFIFPVIVLIARAIIRHNIEFKKIEQPKATPLPTEIDSKINQETIRLTSDDAGKEIIVPVGKSFSIQLTHCMSTGHNPWMISQIPSFIIKSDEHVNDQNSLPSYRDYEFLFEPKEPGTGNIVMRRPCLFNTAKTEEKMFAIIAEFEKIELPKAPPPPPPKTALKINQDTIRLLSTDAGKEIRVPVGKAFTIELVHSPSTGLEPWKILQIPPFITQSDHYVNYKNYPRDFCGGGNYYGFVFEPKESGRGDIVMQQPCSYDATRIVDKTYTIIAE